MRDELTQTQERVLEYLGRAERASVRRIQRETRATHGTLQGLAARGLIEPCLQSSYRITELGRSR